MRSRLTFNVTDDENIVVYFASIDPVTLAETPITGATVTVKVKDAAGALVTTLTAAAHATPGYYVAPRPYTLGLTPRAPYTYELVADGGAGKHKEDTGDVSVEQ
jgi:hypothetical protein